MANIGYISLLLALVAAIYSAVAFIVGIRRQRPALLESAGNGLLAVCGLVSVSAATLYYALLTHNFQIAYVASYTSRDTSLAYLISAFWAGNDGSLLLWTWLLSLAAVVVFLQKRKSHRELMAYAAPVLMVTQAFFLILVLSVSNPFHQLSFAPADGMGLNPLLENPGMILHPPALLAGYVALTIPFAFTIASLLVRRVSDEWLIAVRRWALVSWMLLGIGLLIGAWWAYVELGWGGYWAWDPVENAGLMPWLIVTAFLHSAMMQRRRGILKIWNIVLVVLSFALAIFGTFLTRSGIISSVHTFSESRLGPFFLAFLGLVLIGSLVLIYYRHDQLRGETETESLISRESTFLLNNLLLVGATFAVLLGTVFPIISEMVRGVKISVGAPFFNQVNGPIFLAVLLLTGICALIGWRRASIRNLVRSFLWPLGAAIALGIALFVLGIRQWYAIFAFVLFGFVLFSVLYQWFREVRARHRVNARNYLKAFWELLWANRPRYGGYIVHLGIILMAIGIVGSSFYDVEREATLMPGGSMSVGSYTITYESTNIYDTQSKTVLSATLAVSRDGKMLGRLLPEKYFHRNHEQPVTEVAIRSNLVEDLYVILIGQDVGGAIAFKALVNPLVSWIWIGGGVLVLGGLISFWPQRRKAPVPGRAPPKEKVRK
ncbi:heme lyase CcmF/NrfE family subunit [Chloroflexota bacterium]